MLVSPGGRTGFLGRLDKHRVHGGDEPFEDQTEDHVMSFASAAFIANPRRGVPARHLRRPDHRGWAVVQALTRESWLPDCGGVRPVAERRSGSHVDVLVVDEDGNASYGSPPPRNE